MAAFGLVLETPNPLKPVIHVVIQIGEFDPQLVGVTFVFVFAQFIFAQGVDIGIVEQHAVFDAGSGDLVHHITGTGRATGMQQHFIVTAGRRQNGTLLVLLLCRCIHNSKIRLSRLAYKPSPTMVGDGVGFRNCHFNG